jgi:tRNA (Thr-GGU) A37 N-methylase
VRACHAVPAPLEPDRNHPRPPDCVVAVASAAGKGGAASPILHVSGIDLVDGTPMIDVKP